MKFTMANEKCCNGKCPFGGIKEFQGFCPSCWKLVCNNVADAEEATKHVLFSMEPTPSIRYVLPPQPSKLLRTLGLIWRVVVTGTVLWLFWHRK